MMTPEEVKHWAEMILPEYLRDKARSLESDTISANFTFKKPRSIHSGNDKET
jgi:hypothetical protein